MNAVRESVQVTGFSAPTMKTKGHALGLAIFLAWFRRKAYAAPYDSVLRFSYVVLSVNLIQVYRDGLQSIIVFTFVNMMPLVVMVMAHGGNLLIRKRREAGHAIGSRFLPERGVAAESVPSHSPPS